MGCITCHMGQATEATEARLGPYMPGQWTFHMNTLRISALSLVRWQWRPHPIQLGKSPPCTDASQHSTLYKKHPLSASTIFPEKHNHPIYFYSMTNQLLLVFSQQGNSMYFYLKRYEYSLSFMKSFSFPPISINEVSPSDWDMSQIFLILSIPGDG